MRIGFVGLGQMGAAIAANLVRAGHEVQVWNRSPAKAAPLVGLGAQLAATPRAAAAGAEIVLTMVADDAALSAVLEGDEGLYLGLAPGALHISLSTIGVATADCVAAGHVARGQPFLSAPVFGRPAAAAAAKLFVVAAGDPAQFQRAQPLFAQIGQGSFHVGETPSAANLVKLCGNFMILGMIELLAEAMTLAGRGGVDRQQFLDVMTGTLFGIPPVRNYGAMLVAGEFRPAGFPALLGLKDMRLVAQAAEAGRVPMPVLNVLRDHLLQVLATEGDDVDWSAIGQSVARNAGL